MNTEKKWFVLTKIHFGGYNMYKKIIVIAILLLFFPLWGFAQEFTEGYRDAKWGMSVEKVKSCFKGYKFQKDDDGDIFIEDKIIDIDVKIYFFFFEDKLKEVRIFHSVQNPLFGTSEDIKRGLYNFDNFFNALKDKYGQPGSISKNVPEYSTAADAIELGTTSFYSKWKTKQTDILLYLGKGEGLFSSVTLAVVYNSPYYEKIAKEQSVKSKL